MAKHRKIRHYSHSYRVRKRRRQNLLRVLVFLLILAALTLVGYSVAQSLERLSQEPSSEESSQPSESSSEISDEPESSEPSSEPFSEPAPIEDTDVKALLMPLETMLSPTDRTAFLENVDTELYNTIVLPLKDSAGRIWYQTAVDHAKVCEALTENAVDAAALLAEIEACELDAAAMIYSLQDDYASHAMYGTSYMYQDQSNVTWLDNAADQGGKSWLNPYLTNTQDYLSAIAAELSELGFEEIFVFGNQYPNTSNQRGMGLGNQNGVSQADALENIITLMQDAAGESRIIPAYLGECYTEGVRSQIYTVSPNSFSHTPTAPIIGTDPAVLDTVTAAANSLVPVIGDAALIEELRERGIKQYLLQ